MQSLVYEAPSEVAGIVMLAKFYQDFAEAGAGWAPEIWIEWRNGPASRDYGKN
jgi:hypothetical protein